MKPNMRTIAMALASVFGAAAMSATVLANTADTTSTSQDRTAAQQAQQSDRNTNGQDMAATQDNSARADAQTQSGAQPSSASIGMQAQGTTMTQERAAEIQGSGATTTTTASANGASSASPATQSTTLGTATTDTQNGGNGQTQAYGQSGTAASGAATGSARVADAKAQPQKQAGDMRVSQIIGKSVEGTGGNKIGEVKDLMVDMSSGKIAYAILQPQDNSQIGDRLVALPIGKVSGQVDKDRIVLDIDPRELGSYPTFEKDRWPNFARLGDDGMQRRDMAARDASVSAAQGDRPAQQVQRTGQNGAAAGQDHRFRRASELMKTDLKDREGKDVGDVKDIVVSLESGQIRYGVAEFDTSWFKRGKYVVVPVESIRPQNQNRDLVLNVDREQLQNAPSFDKDQWPDVNDQNFRGRLDKFADRIGSYTENTAERVGNFAERTTDRVTR